MNATRPCLHRLTGVLLLAILLPLATARRHAWGAGEMPPCPCSLKLAYTLQLNDRAGHMCSVETAVDGLEHPYLDLALPAWTNLYQVRDFVRNLRELSATTADGSSLPVHQTGTHTWRIATSGIRSVQLRYKVFADYPGDFYSQINTEHAFLNGANLFLYLPGHRGVPPTLEIQGVPSGWKIGTALPARGATQFQAEDYDHLIDCPIEISAFDEAQFSERGVAFRVITHGHQGLDDPQTLVPTLRKIVNAAFDLMHDVPMKDYLFIYHFTGLERGGGMEHRNSTAINVPPRKSPPSNPLDPAGIAGVSAHEFFHLWNVKRIRPVEYFRPDHTRPFPTRALWFSEGATSYYGGLILLRAGLITREAFLRGIAGRIGALAARPARLTQSAEEAAAGAWRYIDPVYLLPENSIDYYGKGALIAFATDLRIRTESGGERSFDDILRFMNRYFAKRGIGFRFDDLEWVFGAVSDSDFSSFFARHVAGTEELPLREYLAGAGLELVESKTTVADLGFYGSKNHDEPAVVARVDRGSPADAAGLRVGDVLVSDPGAAKPGDLLALKVRRGAEVREISFRPGGKEIPSYRIVEVPTADARQRAIREGFGRSK